MNRLKASAVAGAVASLTVLVASGCSAGPLTSATAHGEFTSGLDTTASLDRDTGVITFPADRFAMTSAEADVLTTAQSYALAACAKGAGVGYTPITVAHDPIEDASSFFGVWLPKYANQFGFVRPMTPADMAANKITGGPIAEPSTRKQNLLTNADAAKLRACRQSKDVQRFDPTLVVAPGPWSGPLGQIAADLYAAPPAEKVVSDYNACLKNDGLAPDPRTPGSVQGSDSRTISAEQVSLALRVVACKDQVSYVQRLADIVAQKQAPIIEKYASELTMQRTKIDKSVAEAQAFIASHQGYEGTAAPIGVIWSPHAAARSARISPAIAVRAD